MKSPWTDSPWTPRDWQRAALPRVLDRIDNAPAVRAVMGSGKSILIAELVAHLGVRTVVITPTQKLVKQLAGTFRERGPRVGTYYANSKNTSQPVIVCCNDSLRSLAAEVDPPELFVVDEAHRSECDQVKDVILGPRDFFGNRSGGWAPRWRVGFTATPYRADEAERLTLFAELVYDYGPAQAIRDGVVVPPKIVHYPGTRQDTNGACLEMIQGAVRSNSGPGLVDAKSIADAMEFAAELEAAGIRTKPVHSRLHDATNERRLAALKAGELDCLVHVQMLSEGVDLPWLRWLCCRRPIASKVLFAQYVGRGLRSLDADRHPEQVARFGEKTHCTIFDPHDLFGSLSLDYEAVIGMGDEDDSSLLPALELAEEVERVRNGDPDGETLNGVPLKFVPPAVSYVRRLHLEFQCRGMLSMRLPDMAWRAEPMTQQQVRKIDGNSFVLNAEEIPPDHRKALGIAIKMALAETLNRGTASDLISILTVLRAYRWPGTEVEAA